jgi:hypothetical protein
MSVLRIASLTAICAVALIGSAYAGTNGPSPVPGPIAGAGIAGVIAGGFALYAWYRQRK